MENKIIISSNNIADTEYSNWLEEIKQLYKSSQIKASLKVNKELLKFYWQLGKEMVDRKIEEKWGSKIVERLSLDLKSSFPESKGFSSTNLWYIRRWYLFYNQSDIILPQVVAEFGDRIYEIPWGHHRYIISKCKDIKEALYYIDETIANNWSRSALEDAISYNEYSTRGKAINNFGETLPIPQQQLAKDILKDPYHFDFLNIREKYDESELENALSKDIEKFLLELGKGFAFVGRQVELRVSDTSYYIDMLFYHIKLKCYVAVELKVVDFKPEFVGKLNFYVNAVNKLLKGDDDKPTIGLLICKNKDNTKVEWSLSGVQTPIGVAEYQMPDFEEFKSSLPTIEELEEQLKKID